MEQAFQARPEQLRERVLVQGAMPRTMLLAEHRRRVKAGQASVIMGLQSFGEGLDLPGDVCRHLWITKLPFGSPANPVSEARAEYVEEIGGDYFDQVVVPSIGVRLLQWTGRRIRNETDTATITCYDSRLTEKGYGPPASAGTPALSVGRARAKRGAGAPGVSPPEASSRRRSEAPSTGTSSIQGRTTPRRRPSSAQRRRSQTTST